MDEKDRRNIALDALRGLAVLLMCLSGVVPGGLPNWMYHGYNPQFLPDDAKVFQEVENRWQHRPDWPALTWVDVVFPAFLFSMGAAIPLALRRRRAASAWRAAGHVAGRFGLLVAFAVYAGQIAPHFIDATPGVGTWLVALLAMLPAAMVLQKLPTTWPKTAVVGVRSAGWAAAIGLLAWVHSGERTFSWGNNDIIILLLAHMYLVAALLWLALPRLGWLRVLLAVPLLVLAHHQAINAAEFPQWRTFGGVLDAWTPGDGWLDLNRLVGTEAALLDLRPLWDMTWYKFLWLVLPATLVGDWLAAGRPGDVRRAVPAAGLLAVAVVLALAGLRHYGHGGWWPTPWTALAALLPLAASGWLVWGDGLLRRLWLYAMALTAAGLVFAVLPAHGGWFEGGVKKGPPATLSYYLVSGGLSAALLLAFTLWADVRRLPGLGLFALVGQNALLAYLAIRNLLAPLAALPWLAGRSPDVLAGEMLHHPWPLAAWAAAKTALLGGIVAALTRLRVVWRV